MLSGLLACAPGAAAAAHELDFNAWPFVTTQAELTGGPVTWNAAGSLLFHGPSPDGGTIGGFRPLWVQTSDAAGHLHSGLSLYPLFSYTADPNSYRWSVFDLISRAGLRAGADPSLSQLEQREAFDLWPFWFSRQTADPETSYRALFPIFGTIKHRLGYDRLFWAPFPLYFQTESRGAITTHAPWPFLRWTKGAAQGFGLWPLFGWENRPGVSSDSFYLWPLGFDSVTLPKPGAPAGTLPEREDGFLPFYDRVSGPGMVSEDYLWPFFGHTDRTIPDRYDETRWFWPFLVQGRGDSRYVNRWGPFYTHSVIQGYDKTWYAWPILRKATWTESGLIQTKTQGLFFVYWSLEQRSATHPALPPARRTHLWPLFSFWDNGAGRRQWQVLSPFEALFTDNDKVRQSWTPLFALIRYDRNAPGDVRFSLLWNAVTWRRSQLLEFAAVRPELTDADKSLQQSPQVPHDRISRIWPKVPSVGQGPNGETLLHRNQHNAGGGEMLHKLEKAGAALGLV